MLYTHFGLYKMIKSNVSFGDRKDKMMITILSYFTNLITQLNCLHVYFTIGAFLCFLPELLGYQTILIPYADNLESLSGFEFQLALVLSIGIIIPLVLESVLEYMTNAVFYNNEMSENSKLIYSKFPTVYLLLIVATDLAFFFIVRDHQWDSLPGLTTFRDVLVISCFLFNLNKIGSNIWTLNRVFAIGTIFITLNWLYVWMSMSDYAYNCEGLLIFFSNFDCGGVVHCFIVCISLDHVCV